MCLHLLYDERQDGLILDIDDALVGQFDIGADGKGQRAQRHDDIVVFIAQLSQGTMDVVYLAAQNIQRLVGQDAGNGQGRKRCRAALYGYGIAALVFDNRVGGGGHIGLVLADDEQIVMVMGVGRRSGTAF